MSRYLIISEPCPCPKCKDMDYVVIDTELELIVGEFTSEEDARSYIVVREGVDKIAFTSSSDRTT
jgi:hypothetical protein